LALIGYLSASTLVGLFDVSAEAAHQARVYLRVSLAGIPAALIILAMTGSLRGLQDTRTPLAVAAAANLSNIGLNFGLVYGLGLGIAGSGVGTVISQWSAATAYVFVVTRGARALGVSLRPDWRGCRTRFTASARGVA